MPRRLFGYLSVRDWKTRLIFWCGHAIFTLASNWVMSVHDKIMDHSRWWTLLLAPVVMVVVSFLTHYVFPGAQGSGIPGGIFSPSLSAGTGLGADLAPFIPYAPVATVVVLGMVGYFTGVV